MNESDNKENVEPFGKIFKILNKSINIQKVIKKISESGN